MNTIMVAERPDFLTLPRPLSSKLIVCAIGGLSVITVAVTRAGGAPNAWQSACAMLLGLMTIGIGAVYFRSKSSVDKITTGSYASAIAGALVSALVIVALTRFHLFGAESMREFHAPYQDEVRLADLALVSSFAIILSSVHVGSGFLSIVAFDRLRLVAAIWIVLVGAVNAVDVVTQEPVRSPPIAAMISVLECALGLWYALNMSDRARRRTLWLQSVYQGKVDGWSLIALALVDVSGEGGLALVKASRDTTFREQARLEEIVCHVPNEVVRADFRDDATAKLLVRLMLSGLVGFLAITVVGLFLLLIH